jgi:DNA-directed RNA polymerase specialized sigma subunit
LTAEYRIDIKVRNNMIMQRIEQAGFKNINAFCVAYDIYPSQLGEIIAMKCSPLKKNGQFKLIIEKISEILCCSPLDLFSDNQLHTILQTNKKHIEVNEAEMKFMLQNSDQKLLEEKVFEDQFNGAIEDTLDTLTIRERKVINMRFGLGEYNREHTLKEIGNELGTLGERVRQIEAKALRKLRHPDRNKALRPYLNEQR